MSAPDRPFDTGRPRPIVTALDSMRRRLDHDAFDAAVFSLPAVAADLGYGDVRALPGAIAWVDRLRSEGKRIGVVGGGDRVATALEIAGISSRVDVVVTGSSAEQRVREALHELGVDGDRAVVVAVDAPDLEAARSNGVELAVGVARGAATPQELRRAGAVAIVADLQELLRAAVG